MNNKVYLWHSRTRDFWIVVGMENHWLLGLCYVISDRNYQKKEYMEIRRKILFTNERAVTRSDIKRLIGRYRDRYKLFTLPSGDQPSLLIE